MGMLKYLIIHCTDTPEGREVTKADIHLWHIIERGWSRYGYADLIQLDGNLVLLTDWNQDIIIDRNEITNGARGINGLSRHVVYSGGSSKRDRKPKDTRTDAQKLALLHYAQFHVLRYPDIIIGGHNQFSTKACPSFDVPAFLRENGFAEKNICQN